jgi:hypothetical protein
LIKKKILKIHSNKIISKLNDSIDLFGLIYIKKLFNSLGNNNIISLNYSKFFDFRKYFILNLNFSDYFYYFLLNTNLRYELPLFNFKLYEESKKNLKKIFYFGTTSYNLNYNYIFLGLNFFFFISFIFWKINL